VFLAPLVAVPRSFTFECLVTSDAFPFFVLCALSECPFQVRQGFPWLDNLLPILGNKVDFGAVLFGVVVPEAVAGVGAGDELGARYVPCSVGRVYART